MSGYFFFLGFTWSWRAFAQKLAGRVKTLLLPFLFWTGFVVAIRFLGQSIPAVRAYFTGEGALLAELPLYDLANALFGFTRAPEAYHFWFIRDLMVLMLFSPLLVLCLRTFALPFLLSLFSLWISGNWPLYTPDVVGVLFFSLGGYLAMRGTSLFFLDKYGPWFVVLYVPLLLVDVIWYTAPFNLCLHRCGIVIGLVAILYASKRVPAGSPLQHTLLRLCGASFFVYAAHEPLLGIVRTLAFQFFPLDQPYTMVLLYLFVPLAVIVVLVALHVILRVVVPRALRLVTGGR
jgi:surface polysaccharide O-acyltransferase-like enzyme